MPGRYLCNLNKESILSDACKKLLYYKLLTGQTSINNKCYIMVMYVTLAYIKAVTSHAYDRYCMVIIYFTIRKKNITYFYTAFEYETSLNTKAACYTDVSFHRYELSSWF